VSTLRNPGKIAKHPAKALHIDGADLPNLGRPWTKRDIHELRAERPGWLTEARQRHGARMAAAAEEEAARLDIELARLGYIAPDEGTVDQGFLYIDGALIHLQHATGCSQDAADRAAWRRWPKSMEALEDYDDGEDDESDWA
jgi:hypothetical protein